jgi:release factor glutamine methyltransferase
MPDTLRHLLAQHRALLDSAGVPDADASLAWIIAHVTGLARGAWRLRLDRPAADVLSPGNAQRLSDLVARRARREPVQYVIGESDFRRLTLGVTPDVLIPRPETEEVAGWAIRAAARSNRARVLDAATGSGCIALSIADEVPGADVHACDVSAPALAVARGNAERLGLGVTFHCCDLLAQTLPLPGPFDVLVSNPPYVEEAEAGTLAPEVRDHEPHLALFAPGDALLFYRALARHARALLAPGGTLVLETHADHAAAVAALLQPDAFADVQVHRDVSERPRVVVATRR